MTIIKKISKFLLILFIILFFLFIDCGNEPPVISAPIYNILIYQKGSFNLSRDSIFLSVYFVLFDENGYEDINRIKITHTQTDYTWVLPNEILNDPTIWKEETYIGFSFLEYNDARSILTGEYIIDVEDKSGNSTQIPFYVEIEGLQLDKPYEIPDIKYDTKVINNKEIKISGDDYSSCEIKFINDSNFFNGGRKKFKKGKKIILNNKDMPAGTIISVRVNKDDNETMVYFLENIILE